MNPLHPNVTIAWRIAGVIAAIALTAAVMALESFVLAPNDIRLLTMGVLPALTALLSLGFALLWPGLSYRHWRWEVGPDRVTIQKGVVWRSRSLIPRVRIQHVDTRTSPLERWLGLSTLVIYTAGTHGSDAEIPGLAAADAEQLREELAQLEELDERH